MYNLIVEPRSLARLVCVPGRYEVLRDRWGGGKAFKQELAELEQICDAASKPPPWDARHSVTRGECQCALPWLCCMWGSTVLTRLLHAAASCQASSLLSRGTSGRSGPQSWVHSSSPALPPAWPVPGSRETRTCRTRPCGRSS